MKFKIEIEIDDDGKVVRIKDDRRPLETNDKRYKDLGLSISDIENDRSLLYGSLV